MPPEPLPWDRKDFFRKRKHERSESRGGSVARWRDSSHHGGSRDLNRWGSAADFRRPIGHGKQGNWHFFPEESGHGYASSRSGEKIVEDESCRPISRGDTRYGRYRRDNRGSYNQREWRDHSWDGRNGFSNLPGRAHEVNNEQKSRDDIPSYSSHSNGGFGNTWDQIQLKDQHDKMNGSNGLSTGQRCERENSMGLNDWKPIKWTRSGSLSSRGSGFSHLSSSKSLGAIDSSEAIESETKHATPVHSPSGDANACVTSAAALEDTASRKKPRLGWGEGLAKYEKKKVDGPDVMSNKDEAEFSVNNLEPVHSLSSSLVDKSPRMMSLSDCASPATPSSVACSSLPGLDDKSFDKATDVNDITNLSGSPALTSQNHFEEGFSFNLENLDSDSVANLSAVLFELLQSYDPSSMDSSFVKATTVNKILILKGEVTKKLEVTESEIDQLETELKLFNSVLGGSSPSAASSSLPLGVNLKSCDEEDDATNRIPRPPPLQIHCAGDAIGEKLPICNEIKKEISGDGTEEDVDSPGTMTSKFVGPSSAAKVVSSDIAAGDIDHVQLRNEEVGDSLHCSEGGNTSGHGDDDMVSEGDKAAPTADSLGLYAEKADTSRDAILLSNKDLAKEAEEVLHKVLPRGEYKLDITAVGNVSSSPDLPVKERFVQRKRFLKFKERVITLKFKAFQHLWKEDMRLLSIRKHRAKSQKKLELSLRSVHNGYQKHRSSIRSRFSSPAGNLSLVPTTEVINFTSKLLSDSQVKLYRDTLKMPALILDKRERIVSRFISNNGLVEDPCAVEKGRGLINPWTPEEREIFMDKLAIYGKDFQKIASFLDHKRTADCVEFYYKNHKSDYFEKNKKKLDIGKPEKSLSSGNYLMTLGKKWNRERNAASLDILGAASVMVANADGNMRSRQTCSRRSIMGPLSESKASWRDDRAEGMSGGFDVLGNERETAAADVLAGICSSLSSEAMSSYITSSVDPGDNYREWKSQKVDSIMRRPFTPEVAKNADEETCSDDSCGETDSANWTDEEKSVFIRAVSTYGRDFAKISQCVRTRTRDQCKVFFSKARKCLGLDMMHTGLESERTFAGDDASGGGGGSENACALEAGSGVCSTKSVSKIEEDLPLSSIKINHDESDPVEALNSQSELSSSEGRKEGELLDHKENVGVSEPRSSDVCQTWGRPNVVSDGDSNIVNGVDEQSEILPANESESVLVTMDTVRENVAERGMSFGESVSACEGNDPERPNTGMKPVDEASCGTEMEGLDDEKGSASTSVLSGSPFVARDSNSTGNASHLAVDRSCSGFSLNSDYQHPVSLELNSKEKSCAVSLPHGIPLACANPVSLDLSATCADKNGAEDKMSSTVDFLESAGGCRPSVNRADPRAHLTGLPLLTNSEPSQVVLPPYPSQIPVQKEMNGDVRCRNLSEVPNSDRGSSNSFSSQGCYLQKCNSLIPPCSVMEFPLATHKMEQTSERRRAHSQSLSDSENSSRSSGDVKLFGKILSNASSVQKATSTQRENEEREGSHVHKSSNNKSSNLKFTNSDGNSALLKFDPNSYLGLENVQMRGYTYWDGTRLQATFPSMPDSAILLAKYPAAFTSFPTSSPKMEPQQPPPAMVKSGERCSNGVSVFPTREISSNGNGSADYQMYRSREAAKVQPFTVDMKSRQEVFSELQRRNGMEALASFQHQGRGIVGMRGGIVVGGGGQCTAGVSDPVAALKLHFAKTEQFGGQTSGIMREEESWRGKGDIGM